MNLDDLMHVAEKGNAIKPIKIKEGRNARRNKKERRGSFFFCVCV